MWITNKKEWLIYRHAQREAYKAGIITLSVRKSDPRALLLPGREDTWKRYIAGKSTSKNIRKQLPNLEEATRLHPPINEIVKKLYGTRDTEGTKPELYRKWVNGVLEEWKRQGSPEAGPQLINKTLVLIEGKGGRLFLHHEESQEKIHFIISADLLK